VSVWESALALVSVLASVLASALASVLALVWELVWELASVSELVLVSVLAFRLLAQNSASSYHRKIHLRCSQLRSNTLPPTH
jgi:hypothetical protein